MPRSADAAIARTMFGPRYVLHVGLDKGVQPGYRPVRLPDLHGVAVDEPPGGFDGGLIINTIQLDHADGSVVKSDDIGTIDRHLGLQVPRSVNACPKDDSERVGIRGDSPCHFLKAE
jgi:hypothetical protein